MQTVDSTDETEIAYELEGDGPPLVLLHGGSGCRRHWDAFVPHLAGEFTVVRPDRRGRGDSGDGSDYSLQREVEDLRAVLGTLDDGAAVFGHSFGGLVALAAAEAPSIERLVLYEPALLVGDHRGDDLAARMARRLEAGDRKAAMRLFYEESSDMADVTRAPWWPEMVHFDRADTVVRENEAVEQATLEALPTPEVSTLLLTGEEGPDHLRDAVFALDEALPDSNVVELDGVGHVGTMQAPERVAEPVSRFVGAWRPDASSPRVE